MTAELENQIAKLIEHLHDAISLAHDLTPPEDQAELYNVFRSSREQLIRLRNRIEWWLVKLDEP